MVLTLLQAYSRDGVVVARSCPQCLAREGTQKTPELVSSLDLIVFAVDFHGLDPIGLCWSLVETRKVH
jgi:hypothetical protein